MKLQDALILLEKGMKIRHGSVELFRPDINKPQLGQRGGMFGAKDLMNNFFDNNWEVEVEGGKWNK